MKVVNFILYACVFMAICFTAQVSYAGVCGDGHLDVGEECDDGNNIDGDGCPSNCRPSCGDGTKQSFEECDDGNNAIGDGCNPICQIEECGNGRVDPRKEECDDGNRNDLDSCTNQCTTRGGCVPGKVRECTDYVTQDYTGGTTPVEGVCARWEQKCIGDAGWEPCQLVDVSTPTQPPSECVIVECDPELGVVETFVSAGTDIGISSDGCTRQECDGNGGIVDIDRTPAEGAPLSCFCPNGIVGDYPGEECDDGNNNNNDECSNSCKKREICDGKDNDGDGDVDEGYPDTDRDGVKDCIDICPGGDDKADADHDGKPDFCDPEICNGKDDNGINGIDENFPDSDGDGVKDCIDICAGGDDHADADHDQKPDFCDPEDCNGIDDNGIDGIDEGFPDSDGDGVKDCMDICAGGDDHADADHDQKPDFCDPEACNGIDDNGIDGIDEGFPDTDGDGVADCADIEVCDGFDNDGDGKIDEGFPDSDHDGVKNCLDICKGGDDHADADHDGKPNFCDPEICNGIDDNGIRGIDEGFRDSDHDGIANCMDVEICNGIDDNGINGIDENFPDTDGDGVKDCQDICAGGNDSADADQDQVPDFCDPEICNGIDDNGINGVDEGFPDADGDHIGDACDAPDCGNGIKEEPEDCDDGNDDNTDECLNNCTFPVPVIPNICGDGVVGDEEECDGTASCKEDCTLIVCGNSVVETGEECDDGNKLNGDGCSSTCTTEETPDEPSENPDTPVEPTPAIDNEADCLGAGGTWTPSIGDILDQGEADPDHNQIVFDQTSVSGACSVASLNFVGGCAASLEPVAHTDLSPLVLIVVTLVPPFILRLRKERY
ncbi:DUF4215 domain-containing protein [bacterium]|nr:DUF4215 domain-containing protein [bacterium]